MALAVPWSISPFCVIILVEAFTCISCHGLTIDQIILQAKNRSKIVEHPDSNVVTIEYDMMFKAEDLLKLNKERIPFKDEARRREIVSESELQRRNALRDLSTRWTNNIIPYTIASGTFNTEETNVIAESIADYNKYTCLQLVPRTNQNNYMHLQNGAGCSSYVGMVGGKQPVNLGDGCRLKATILHEIGHAAGFYHEQTRPDRDTYVKILEENIYSSLLYNFDKYTTTVINTYDVPYDYLSMMHYGQYAFSKNGKRTIETLDATKQNVIGTSEGFSFRDVKLLNLMYNCKPSQCADKQCPGEGYVGKDCKCYCPGNPVIECSGGGGGETCTNDDPNCDYWAGQGYCTNEQYKDFMEKNCTKACNMCATTTPGGGEVTTTPGEDCTNHDQYCDHWASEGYCTDVQYKEFMEDNCAKACNLCGGGAGTTTTASATTTPVGGEDCTNNDENCGYWADEGHCTNVLYKTYMETNCAKACNLCEDCTNNNTNCDYWAGEGYCTNVEFKEYMETDCKKACNLCGDA